jgi:anaerobic selenocysteine-containing dehydrogenase
LEFLVLSSPVPLAAGKNADVILPSACWLEKKGTVMTSGSQEHRLEPVLPPPGAALPEGEILTLLAQGMGARLSSAAVSIGWDGASLTRDTSWQRELEMTLATMLGEKPIAGRVVPSEKSLVLLGVEGTVRSGDGIASGASRWARSAMPCPYIEMSRQDATRLGAEGLVKVASEHGESVLPVRVTSQLPAGVAIVSSQFAETRTLFGWESRPEVVEVSVVARETSTGGAKTHG